MAQYELITGHTIECEEADAQTRALLARLSAMVADSKATANDMVVLIYSPENPVMDRTFAPGRGVVTPRVLDNPIYRAMSDMLYRKRLAQDGVDVATLAARATLTTGDVAKRLGVQPSAIRQAIASGRLCAWLRDGVNYIDPAELTHFELAPRGRPSSDSVPRASSDPLEIREGFDEHYVLRVKVPAELRERIVESGNGYSSTSGTLSPWRRVLVRVAHRKKNSLRLFVLEPGDALNEIEAGAFSVRGRFVITEKVNKTRQVEAEWEKREAF
jgi:hypothetical protein